MQTEPIRMLVVDDDPSLLAVLETGLRMTPDFDVAASGSADEAMRLLAAQAFDVVVADYMLDHPSITGLDLLRAVRDRRPDTLVIIVTAFASLEVSLEAIHLGAYDFLTKPFQLEELLVVVRNAANLVRLNRENRRLRDQVVKMIAELDEIERSQLELLDRIRQLSQAVNAGGNTPADMASTLTSVQMHELRRRTMLEQIAAYLRVGEAIHDRLVRQRRTIEALVETGELPRDILRIESMGKDAQAS